MVTYNVEIVNDTNIDFKYEVQIDGKNCIKTIKNPSICYSYSSTKDEAELRITKIDLWENQHVANKILMILFSLDLIWGNLMESDNLPISIKHANIIKHSKNNMTKQVLLSNIIKVNELSIQAWKKCVYIQLVEVLTLIALLALIFSFIFPGYFKIISLVMAFLIDIPLCFAYKTRFSKMYGALIKYLC